MEDFRHVIREKFEALFEYSFDLILVHDNKGIIIEVNQVLLDFLNVSREQLLNKSTTSLLRKENIYLVKEENKKLLKDGKDSNLIIYLVQSADSSPMYYEVNEIPFRNDGKIIATIKIIHDITNKKKAEKEVKEFKKKNQITNNRQNFYKDVITHDTRNMLQVLLSSIELCWIYLKMNSPQEKIEELLNIHKLQILKGIYIVNTVDQFTDLTQTHRQIKKTNISCYLNNAIDTVKKYSPGKLAKITIKNESQYLHVKADKFLGNLFEHVLFIAIHHYQNPDVEVEIKVSDIKKHDAEYTLIEFIDNGSGIPYSRMDLIYKDNQDNINNERRTNLGIYIIKAIIEPYNAQIWVENNVPDNFSKGSKFILAFHQK